MMLSRNDTPIWVPVVMFIGFFVFFFSAPKIFDDSETTIVVFREIPFAWYLIPCVFHLFLCSLGLRIYEWPEFGDDERKVFLRRILILAIVELVSWYGAVLLAALNSWTYDTSLWISLIPPTVVSLYWFFSKPRKQLWD